MNSDETIPWRFDASGSYVCSRCSTVHTKIFEDEDFFDGIDYDFTGCIGVDARGAGV